MSAIYEDRSSYAPDVDPVGIVSLTVECNPGQVDAVLEFLAQVRDRAGVYSVDYTTTVRPPQAQPVLEIVSLAALVDEFTEQASEGETHGEPELQQASEPAEAGASVGSEAAAVEPAADVDAGKDGGVAEPAGEVGTGSGERGE